jgi:hypothetical protein
MATMAYLLEMADRCRRLSDLIDGEKDPMKVELTAFAEEFEAKAVATVAEAALAAARL